MAVRAVTMFASSAPDKTMWKNAVRGAQHHARAGLLAIVSGASLFTTLIARREASAINQLGPQEN